MNLALEHWTIVAGVFGGLLVVALLLGGSKDSSISMARLIGGLLNLGGAGLLIYFFWFFETSVGTAAGRVNNFGLLQDKLIGVVASFGTMILGMLWLILDKAGKRE